MTDSFQSGVRKASALLSIDGWGIFPMEPAFSGAERFHMAENKGNPSGRKAQTKSDAGRKSTSRERGGQAGAFVRKERGGNEDHPAGDGGPEQQAGGPEHRGGDAHEDRNP